MITLLLILFILIFLIIVNKKNFTVIHTTFIKRFQHARHCDHCLITDISLVPSTAPKAGTIITRFRDE